MQSMSAPVGQPALRRELGLWDLVFFNISAVAAVRWLAAAAHAGPASLTLWMLAAVFFFLPSALVVSDLTRRFPQEGGMYIWTKQAFGDWHAFLCAWFYVVSNLLYYPTLLLAGVSMAAYAAGAGAHVAESRSYALPITLAVLWLLFLANFFGLRVAKWTGILGGSSSYVVAAALIAFAVGVAVQGHIATKFDLLPSANLDTLNFWSQIAFGFIGLELAPVLGGEIRDTGRNVARAAVISGAACTIFYIAGTAAMLMLANPASISPLSGLAQAGAIAGSAFSLPFLPIVFAVLLSVSVAGQLGTFLAGNTRLPFAMGLDRYLPAAFARVHPRWGTPYVSLLAQVAGATIFLLMAQFGETLRAAYQILVDMCVLTTFFPYAYIFAAGLRFGGRFAAASGLAVSVLAMAVSAIPPPEAASAATFEAKVLGGSLLIGLAGWFVFRRYRPA